MGAVAETSKLIETLSLRRAMPPSPPTTPISCDDTCYEELKVDPLRQEIEKFKGAVRDSPSSGFIRSSPADSKVQKPRRHRESHALIVCWDEFSFVEGRLRRTGELFESKLGFTTVRYVQLRTKSKRQDQFLSKEMKSWVAQNSRPGNLLVFYYAGHGGLFPEDRYRMGPASQIHWSPLQYELEKASADVLLILCSCESGGAMASEGPLPRLVGRNIELLAACPHDAKAFCGPVGFDVCFLLALESLVDEQTRKGTQEIDEGFSIAALRQRIEEKIVERVSSSFTMSWILPQWSRPVHIYLEPDHTGPGIHLYPTCPTGTMGKVVDINSHGFPEIFEGIEDTEIISSLAVSNDWKRRREELQRKRQKQCSRATGAETAIYFDDFSDPHWNKLSSRKFMCEYPAANKWDSLHPMRAVYASKRKCWWDEHHDGTICETICEVYSSDFSSIQEAQMVLRKMDESRNTRKSLNQRVFGLKAIAIQQHMYGVVLPELIERVCQKQAAK